MVQEFAKEEFVSNSWESLLPKQIILQLELIYLDLSHVYNAKLKMLFIANHNYYKSPHCKVSFIFCFANYLEYTYLVMNKA